MLGQHGSDGDEHGQKAIDVFQAERVSEKRQNLFRKPLQGWRLLGVLTSVALGFMLAIIETSITATALVTIGDYFQDSIKVTWVVLAYLLSYMGFAIIFTRLSDGIGRQAAVVVAYVIFAGFSLAGGLSRTLNQLIAFRVLQGVGGSGLYSMIMVVGIEVTPVRHWGAFSGMIGAMAGIGSVLGPILGGVITERASWRWIYLYNVPIAAVGIVLIILSWPRREKSYQRPQISWLSLRQVDWLGSVLLLAASTLLVFALQEGGSATFAWNSPTLVGIWIVSGVCWIAFIIWVSWLSFGVPSGLRAIFPIKIAVTRPLGPAIVMILFTGFPYFVAVINLPQRFQIVNGNSPIQAGVHLLPLLCAMALGSFLGGAISSKKNFTSQTLIAGASFILLGCGLLSTLRGGRPFYSPTYGYEILLGLGVGLTTSGGTLLANLSSNAEDLAAAQGALSQARILGGSVGLAMATTVLNNNLRRGLSNTLTVDQVRSLEKSLTTLKDLSISEQGLVAQIYGDSFNTQMRICTYLSVVGLVAAAATYQRRPASVAEMKEKQKAASAESSESTT